MGRGVWYLFLSTMVFGALYDLDLEPFLGFLLAGFIAGLGGMSIFHGLQKTIKLESLRKIVIKLFRENSYEVTKYLERGPMGYEEWNQFSKNLSQNKISWTKEEFTYICAALSFKVKCDDSIDEEEFKN